MRATATGLEFFKALNLYFTPFAIFLIILGLIVVPEIPRKIFNLTLALVALSLLFNIVASSYLLDHPESWQRSGYIRAWINLALNAAIFWILAPFWGPAWLLLAISPIAIALYGDEKITATTTGVVAALLIVNRLIDGNPSAKVWGESISQIGFILLLSLFINRIGRSVKIS
ncbi:MAG: hypothetical protein HY400_05105 [Elusimicrobia bacterium]|nr:hypothetical protein [Elusimicrobiota bacterium]